LSTIEVFGGLLRPIYCAYASKTVATLKNKFAISGI